MLDQVVKIINQNPRNSHTIEVLSKIGEPDTGAGNEKRRDRTIQSEEKIRKRGGWEGEARCRDQYCRLCCDSQWIKIGGRGQIEERGERNL